MVTVAPSTAEGGDKTLKDSGNPAMGNHTYCFPQTVPERSGLSSSW